MPAIDLSILNQRQTPAFYADVFANRPAAGFVGRIFVSTNTFAFYRDNGTGWDLIGGPGSGTITGSGSFGSIALWNGTDTITYDVGLTWDGTANSLTASKFIITGGTSSQFLKGDGSLDSNTYNTGSGAASQVAFFSGTNAITGENNLWWDSANNHLGINTNTPATALDVNHNGTLVAKFNNTTTASTLLAFENAGNEQWWIGTENTNNDFLFYDATNFPTLSLRTTFKTNGQVLIGGGSTGSGKLVVESAASDNGIQIVGANAPSLRIDSAATGPTKRIGLGISTGVNNFIQGSVDRDMCIFNGSTTASPMLFGIYDTTNVQEAARISAARNFLIGTTTDVGSKLQVNGQAYINHNDASVLRILRNGGSNTNTGIEFVNSGSSAHIGSNGSLFGMGGTTGSIPAQPFIIVPSASEKIRLDANGNFGIGASAPSYKVEIQQTATNAALWVQTGGTTSAYTIADFRTGTNASAFQILGDTNASFGGNVNLLTSKSLQWNDGVILNAASSQLRFYTGGSSTLAATISSSQNFLIGTTTDNGRLLQVNGLASFGTSTTGNIQVNNTDISPNILINGGSGSNAVAGSAYIRMGDLTNSRFWIQQINASNNYAYWFFNGSSWSNVSYLDSITGAYVALSDRNKKKNFENSNLGLDAVLKLKPTLYNMENQKDEEDKQLGFIAQEVKDIIPQAYQESGDFIGLNYNPIIAVLTKAIQELNTKIENLK